MPPLGKRPDSRSGGFLRNTVTLLPSRRLSLLEPLPRSHSARCSSSNTIVLPRGLTWANPLGSTVPTRQTWAGNAVSICSCSAFGILATSRSFPPAVPPGMLGLTPRLYFGPRWYFPDVPPVRAATMSWVPSLHGRHSPGRHGAPVPERFRQQPFRPLDHQHHEEQADEHLLGGGQSDAGEEGDEVLGEAAPLEEAEEQHGARDGAAVVAAPAENEGEPDEERLLGQEHV